MAEKPTVNELKQRIEDLKKELTERQIHDNSILEELDTRYSSIFESVPTSIVILDKNGVIIDINPYHITHIGQGKTVKKDYLNHDILNFPSVVEAGLQDEHRDVLNGKPMNLKRIHFPMTTGERDRFFNIRGVPLFKNNEVTGAVIIHEDISEVVSSEKNLKKLHDELELRIEERTAELKQEITERKQAEEIKKVLFAISNAVNFTRNLEDLFEIIHKTLGNIIDVTNFFIAMVDIKKRTLYFPYQVDTNDNDFFPITNFNTKNSLTGLVVSERRPILLKKNDLEKLSAQKGVWGPVPLIWMGAPLIVKDEIIGVVAVQSYLDSNLYNEQDLQVLSGISDQMAIAIDRMQAEESLKMSEEKYRTVLEANPDPVVVYDIEGKVIYFNPAFTRLFGWSLEECLNKKMEVFVPEDAWHETKKMIKKVLAGEWFTGIETWRYHKKGKIIPVNISGAIYKDKDGNPIGSVINLRDISDQKKMEAQFQQAQKMESVGRLAGGVAIFF